MRTLEYAKMAFSTYRRTKSRTFLAMLGMIIGVASVIMMLSIGKATERYILSQVASFGSDLINISNGRGDDETAGGPNPLVKQTLDYQDWKTLINKTWVRLAAPMYITQGLATTNGINSFTQMVGTSGDLITIYESDLNQGRYLTDEDVTSYSRVIVLGSQVAKDYYGLDNPIDQKFTINKKSYRVIGVMKPGGTKFFSNVDKQVYVPFTTLLRDDGKTKVTIIMLKTTIADLTQAIDQVRYVIRDTHNLDNPQGLLSKDDFKILTQADAMKRAGVIGTIISVLLAAIASISLIVGGIGIMNIMYVSVKERTREIGLRKAIGARASDLQSQFLIEAMILSVTGGLIGIIIGTLGSWAGLTILATTDANWTYQTQWSAIAMGFFVSSGIGILFGFLPARKAAKLQAVEAIRYE